jgi:hypothetical protein
MPPAIRHRANPVLQKKRNAEPRQNKSIATPSLIRAARPL